MSSQDKPSWQCVMVLWGDKYPVSLVNYQVRKIRELSSRPARFILVSDRPRDGLDPEILAKPFDPFFLNPKFLRAGCQAKLTIFSPGVIPEDLPAVFVDLDTVIVGDLSRLMDHLDTPRRLRILSSAVLPFGAIGRFAYRVSGGRNYARGNSSVVLWKPGQAAEIERKFKELYEQYPDLSFRPMISDERFISWSMQDHMGKVPTEIAVKFPNDFMHPWAWWLKLKSRLPWVRRRRSRLAVVTLPGETIKPDRLLALSEGENVRDRKNRVLIWSDETIGPLRQQILDYYNDSPVASQN